MTEKEPRSRRPCLLCGCLYGSHIDIGCMKVLSKKDPRIDCDCKTFIGTIEDLDYYEKKKQQRLNTLMEAKSEIIEIVVPTRFPNFRK